MARNSGLGLPWLCRGVALIVLLSVPARGEQKTSGDAELKQRVDRLEEQLREKVKEKEKAAQGTQIGGHAGFVLPIVTWGTNTEPTTINDDFVIGFPVGVTVKPGGPWAFDMELVPTINNHDVELTVHPGVLYAIDENWTAGLRMGFDINNHAWGPTPLINRKICDLNDSMHLFVELPVPIRIGEHSTNVTAALHMGVGF